MSSNFHHVQNRNEDPNGGRERRVNFAASQASNNPLVEAIQRTLDNPRTNWREILPGGSDLPGSDFASNGIEPAMPATDPLPRQPVCGSYCDALLNGPSTSSATTDASLRNESELVYQPLPAANLEPVYQPLTARPIADSPPPPAPAYTMEFVTVGPGIQIVKKKFLPRCLPGPVGDPPAVPKGRPILGRGSQLYQITAKFEVVSNQPSDCNAQKQNENDCTSASAGVHPIAAPSPDNPQRPPGFAIRPLGEHNRVQDSPSTNNAAAANLPANGEPSHVAALLSLYNRTLNAQDLSRWPFANHAHDQELSGTKDNKN